MVSMSRSYPQTLELDVKVNTKGVKLDTLIAAKERIEEQIVKELAKPVDDFDEGHVIQFKRSYERNGRLYDFAAIKIGQQWYLTKSSYSAVRSPLSWDELLDFIGDNEVWYATEWERAF